MTETMDECGICEGSGCEFCDEGHYRHDYIKWAADGAGTIVDLASFLEHEAARYRKMADDGWQLTEPVDDGHIRMEKPPRQGG